MKPKHRNKRLTIIAVGGLAVVFGVFLLLQALGESKQLFKNPSDVVASNFVQGKNQLRIGGLVVEGSVKTDGLEHEFSLVNFKEADPDIPPLKVRFHGVLPDLFREGQGIVVTGKMGKDGEFVAKSVLAKHDENYMPKMPDAS